MGDTQFTPEETAEFGLDITACAIADSFTEAYYYALEKDRSTIASFYCPKQGAGDNALPFIAWNGEVYHDSIEFQSYYEGLTHSHFDVECLDCTVVNPKYLPASDVKGGSGDDTKDYERRMSIAVVAMGNVRLEEPLKGPIREFSETFILTPNPEQLPTPKPTFEKGWGKQWMIQTQNFRFTEWGANEIADGGDAKMQEVKNAAGDGRSRFRGANRGIQQQFAAAGLSIKGKGKA